jgi:hypothetical protein
VILVRQGTAAVFVAALVVVGGPVQRLDDDIKHAAPRLVRPL